MGGQLNRRQRHARHGRRKFTVLFSSTSWAGISGNMPYHVCFHLLLTQGDEWPCLQAFDSVQIFLLRTMAFPRNSGLFWSGSYSCWKYKSRVIATLSWLLLGAWCLRGIVTCGGPESLCAPLTSSSLCAFPCLCTEQISLMRG